MTVSNLKLAPDQEQSTLETTPDGTNATCSGGKDDNIGACSTNADCQQDFRCVNPAGAAGSGACTWSGDTTYYDPTCRNADGSPGIDLTLGAPCANAAGGYDIPICNRGSGRLPAGTAIDIENDGNGGHGAWNCEAHATPPVTGGSAKCTYVLQADLGPGECTDIDTTGPAGASCAILETGQRDLYVNWAKTIEECGDGFARADGGANGAGAGCMNNSTHTKATGDACPPACGWSVGGGSSGCGAGDAGDGSVPVGDAAPPAPPAGVDAGTSTADAGDGPCTPGPVDLAITMTGPSGQLLPLGTGSSAQVTVETQGPDGAWRPASNVVINLDTRPHFDIALVVDNSGSETAHLEDEVNALTPFVAQMFARDPDSRLGLVRVSTNSSILQPLTSNQAALQSAIGGLFIHDGWTALWDGVRQANDVLSAGAATSTTPSGTCYAGSYTGIVVFTDGQDNNSSGQHVTPGDPWDGVPTTLADVEQMKVGGAVTPVYTIGVGSQTNAGELSALATATRGQYASIAAWEQLATALENTASQLDARVPICFVPATCDATQARVTLRLTTGDDQVVVTDQLTIP